MAVSFLKGVVSKLAPFFIMFRSFAVGWRWVKEHAARDLGFCLFPIVEATHVMDEGSRKYRDNIMIL